MYNINNMENTEDFKSALFPNEMKYNDLFEDDEIPPQDLGATSPLYEINIFGKPYVIAIGTANEVTMENSVSFYYFIVYITRNKKIVSKVGIYEVSNDNIEEGEEVSPLQMQFQNYDLLIHPKYYMEPHVLEPFSQKHEELQAYEEQHPDDAQEEKEEDAEGAEGAEEEKEQNDEDEKEEGEVEEEKEEGEVEEEDDTISTERTKKTIQKELYNHYHDLDDVDDDKARKLTLQLMLMNIYLKKLAPPSVQKPMKKEIKKIKELFFPGKNGPFIQKEDLKEVELFDLSPTFLLFFELYSKGIKCLIVEGKDTTDIKQFSMLGSLTEEDQALIRKNKEDRKTFSPNQSHIQVLENYDPTTFFYFTKTPDSKLEFVTKKQIDELDTNEKAALRSAYEKQDHEYLSPSQCGKIKALL